MHLLCNFEALFPRQVAERRVEALDHEERAVGAPADEAHRRLRAAAERADVLIGFHCDGSQTPRGAGGTLRRAARAARDRNAVGGAGRGKLV
jgi:hypothetical protein